MQKERAAKLQQMPEDKSLKKLRQPANAKGLQRLYLTAGNKGGK